MNGVRISELADAVGIAASTVRYYERIGLVPEPERNTSGYRVYSAGAQDRLRFIVRGKALGLSLEQVGELLDVWDGSNCAPTQEHLVRLLDEQQTAVTAQIAELYKLSNQLRDVQRRLGATAAPERCSPDLDCCAPAIGRDQLPHAAVACTLDADAMSVRTSEFAELLRDALVDREQTENGIRFRFAATPGLEGRIRDLAAREQACCSFFRFDISAHGDEVWWDASVDDPNGRPLLDALFALPDR